MLLITSIKNAVRMVRKKKATLPAGATIQSDGSGMMTITLAAESVNLGVLGLVPDAPDLGIWEDTPRISVEAIWAQMASALPADLLASTAWLRDEADHMQAGWPQKAYGFLRCADAAGLMEAGSVKELVGMLEEWF